MLSKLKNKRIAFVGGGRLCRALLDALDTFDFDGEGPTVIGVADPDDTAEGVRLLTERGVYHTRDYRRLYTLDGLEFIIELTADDLLGETIKQTKPESVGYMDHFQARGILDYLRIEKERRRVIAEIHGCGGDTGKIEALFDGFWLYIQQIAEGRNRYSEKIRKNLVAREWALSEIVAGSTIPTFVINQDHVVTNWNQACERLTGYAASEIVGTNRHWRPFRSQKRPIMADLILDGVTEEEVWRYYGTKWRKSALIDGAYEAEEYFPHLGDAGKWLFFTAAPIKTPDGRVVGAIETLWDKTADKRAEEERERHNRELAAKAEELAASERFVTQIIQGSTVPTFVIDKNHVITHWNKALENLTGYFARDLLGTKRQALPFWERERPTMADAILDRLDNTQLQDLYGSWRRSSLIEGAYEAEAFFPNLGESGKWCFFTAAPIKATDGSIMGAIETLWDRSEQKKAEEERERYYTEIAGLCSIYTALSTSLDLDHRIQMGMREIQNFLFTDGVCIFLGESDGGFRLRHHVGAPAELCREDATGSHNSVVAEVATSGRLTIYDELPETDTPEIRRLQQAGIRSLAYIPIRGKDRKSLGVIRMASHRPHHFSTEGKNILELIGNRIGVAIENSMLHEQYIKSEEKYRSLFNNDPNPIFIMDRETLQILDTNQRAQDSYGFGQDEFHRKSFLELGDDTDAELVQGLGSLSAGQSIFFSKKRHFNKDRIPFYVNINVSHASYLERDVLIAATTDVTETVEKETQLIQASKMTTLGQMAAGIAHEINQPLNVIQVCADYFLKMLKRGETIGADELGTLANDISDNVQRAAEIIRHMRDFSRQSEAVRHLVDLREPIRDVFKVMGHQLQVHKIAVDLDLADPLPPILAEHNRLEQVFINLVTNAIDAMEERAARDPAGTCERRLTIRAFAEADRVVATVSDTGSGMRPEIVDKIFEPFFTTKEVGKGTGLGVSISYGIVKEYEGTIGVKSRPGAGTTFTLTFPAVDPDG